MTRKTSEQPIDQRLERLLEIEHRLEETIRVAEAEAAARVASARADVDAARQREATALEVATLEQERADLETHAAALERIAADSAAAQKTLTAIPDAVIERLAREAIARAIGLEERR
ncbi:MAG: hypothetical protein IT384_00570 [Deltaproteobacteria bacterium]|nr:hypothetical protein [Deltaproteobacteria bacterium]